MLYFRNSENKAAIGFTYEDSTPVEDSKTKATMEEDDNSDFEEVDLGKILLWSSGRTVYVCVSVFVCVMLVLNSI